MLNSQINIKMASFCGTDFIKKLKELKIPGSDKLSSQSIDWVFYDSKLQPVAKFLEWFSKSISSEDLLTDEELSMYNEMVENDSLMSVDFLDSIDRCGYSSGFYQEEQQLSPEIPIEEVTEKELKRENQLCLQKMELQDDINQQHKKNGELAAEIQEKFLSLDKQADNHKKTIENMCTSLDTAIINLGAFCEKNKYSNSTYLNQLDFSKWQQHENRCRVSIQDYINKQFKQGESSSLEDAASSYCLLDSGKIDELIKTSNVTEYNSNVSELNRLSKMIELSEMRLIESELEKVKFESHINEMENILKPALISNHAETLMEEYACIVEEKQAITKQFNEMLGQTLHDVKSVAAFERCKTISGDYKAKLQRQECYLKKQDIVTDFLLEQLARYDFIRICLETEKNELSQMVNLVGDLNKFLIDKGNNFNERKAILIQEQETKIESQYDKIFDNFDYKADFNDSYSELMKKLNETQVRKKSYIDKMQSLCGAFEKSLFGKSSLRSLPSSWLDPDLIDKSEIIENDLWSFTQEMIETIKAIEEKKRILAVNPEISKEMIDWTSKLSP